VLAHPVHHRHAAATEQTLDDVAIDRRAGGELHAMPPRRAWTGASLDAGASTAHATVMVAWVAVAMAGSTSIGVAIADPVGATVLVRPAPTLAVQAIAGARVLCDDTCVFPGPLVTGDALVVFPPSAADHRVRVGGHAGAGLGAGWVTSGCWFDAVTEVCVDRTTPTAIVRLPIGVDLAVRRLELSFEVVPAIRLAPDAHFTWMGGFAFRRAFAKRPRDG
jgi:hypothetical protein